jgi:hypothetical protein
MSIVRAAKLIKGKCLKYFLENFLYKIDHCRDDNTLVHFYCEEEPYSMFVECLHYEGTSIEELALLLAGLLELEKCLRVESHVEFLDRATEKLRIKVYRVPKRICGSMGVKKTKGDEK